jgi:superoxide dismutase, Fe-Mn family
MTALNQNTTSRNGALLTSSQTAHLDRRKFLSKTTRVLGAGILLASGAEIAPARALSSLTIEDEFKLPQLPYAYEALEPIIDKETMNIHHTKHHQTYVTKLNEAIAPHAELAGKSLEDLLRNIESVPAAARTAIRNHGGGHHNHSLFWKIMRPAQQNNAPTGRLADHLNSTFGSFEKFKEAFSKNALDQFGSGWSWLVISRQGNQDTLELVKTANQDSPLMEGKRPILGIDVWEHAYYLKYQNRRADYVSAWWNVVNWDEIANYLTA